MARLVFLLLGAVRGQRCKLRHIMKQISHSGNASWDEESTRRPSIQQSWSKRVKMKASYASKIHSYIKHRLYKHKTVNETILAMLSICYISKVAI